MFWNWLKHCFFFILPVPTASKHCYVNGEYHKHGGTWRNDCNRCECSNGKFTCTKIWCGKKTCHFTNSLENDECHCRPVKVDCIKPPCEDWGICDLIDFRTEETFCTPDTPTANLTENCAKVSLKFNVDIIPKVTFFFSFLKDSFICCYQFWYPILSSWKYKLTLRKIPNLT